MQKDSGNALLRPENASEVNTQAELVVTPAINDPANLHDIDTGAETIIPNCLRTTHNRFLNPHNFDNFSPDKVDAVRDFHRGLPNYQPTPLHSLPALAEKLGIGQILVKDEGYRFDLNAFKVLGGSYAVARLLGKEYGLSNSELSLETLREKITEPMTFATATDGNHGRGIAWAAHKLGQKAVVYMPAGTAQERVTNIEKLGATVIVTEFNYDDTVRLANQHSNQNNWRFVQDTSWEGYEEIPLWIMQGYTTIVGEVVEQLAELETRPTHILLQAGVGSMAGALLAAFGHHFGPEKLTSLILEPSQADCIYHSAMHEKGEMVAIADLHNTIMAGLACGEPCSIGWEVLRANASGFVSCHDSLSATGMRVLASPTGADPAITAGESGSIGIGVLYALATRPNGRKIMQQFGLDKNAVVFVLNTEGNTDPVNYQQVVWEGKYPMI